MTARSTTQPFTTQAPTTRRPTVATVADDRAPVPRGVVRVASFEESGPCALERIARESRAGDAALLLGPAAFAEMFAALRSDGPAVEIVRVGRVAGRWRLPSAVRALLLEREVVVSGARARAVVRAAIADGREPGGALRDAGVPAEPPPAPAWPEGRRDRIRRALGLARDERALLVGGDPAEWIDPTFVVRAVAMARVSGARLRLVVAPGTARLDLAERFLVAASGGGAPIVDPRAARPWEILPALDGLVLDRDGLVDAPLDCRGWRTRGLAGLPCDLDAGGLVGEPVSPLPALWALACGVPAFVHESIDLGRHGEAPGVRRFDRDVAQFARLLAERAADQPAPSTSAAAASR
jgi:hypothetical protein